MHQFGLNMVLLCSLALTTAADLQKVSGTRHDCCSQDLWQQAAREYTCKHRPRRSLQQYVFVKRFHGQEVVCHCGFPGTFSKAAAKNGTSFIEGAKDLSSKRCGSQRAEPHEQSPP